MVRGAAGQQECARSGSGVPAADRVSPPPRAQRLQTCRRSPALPRRPPLPAPPATATNKLFRPGLAHICYSLNVGLFYSTYDLIPCKVALAPSPFRGKLFFCSERSAACRARLEPGDRENGDFQRASFIIFSTRLI